MSRHIANFTRGWKYRVWIGVVLFLSMSAPSAIAQSAIAPNLSLTANGFTQATVYQGAPLILSSTVYHPNEFATDAVVAPLAINMQNGSWANAVRLQIVSSAGIQQTWPVQLLSPPTGSLTLDAVNTGTLTWVVAPSATAGIAPGSYLATATLDTTASAGTTGWNGVTNSYVISILIAPAPAAMTADQQEEQATLSALYDHLLGNNTQAIADLDSFVSQNPGSIRAQALKGDYLEQNGQFTDALSAYDEAVGAFYDANPTGAPEAPEALLDGQGRLRSELLSQTHQRGTPQVQIAVKAQGTQAPGDTFVDLQITNVGADVAPKTFLNQLAVQVLNGAGQAAIDNTVSPRLPIATDFLAVNGSATVRIFVSSQGAVGTVSLTESGTVVDIFGTPAPFTQTQTVSLNSSGGGGTPTPLMITASNETRTYGGSTPNLNQVTYSGFASGDGPGSLSGLMICTTSAAQTSPVGAYPITCSGLSSPNYSITFAPGTLTITPASLTVSANTAARQYGQPNPLFTASLGGFVNGDGPSALTGTLSCTTSATASTPASGGPYLIVCSGLNSTNYSIGYLPGLLTITPAPLTITATNQSRVYGQANPAFTASYSSFANGDGPGSLAGTLNCSTSAATSSAPGNYPITCSGQTSSNYSISYVPGQLTITGGVGLTITASSATRQYGQANPAFTVSYIGFVNGDGPGSLTGTLACSTTATATSPVGSYPVNCSGLASATYSISYVAGQFTITGAPLAVTANGASRQYGQPNPAFTATFNGFMNNESPAVLGGALICASAAVPASPVSGSPYSIICSGLSSTNYLIGYAPGQLTITPAPLTITASNATRQVGQANPAFSAAFNGFVNGESAAVLSGTLTCATTATTSSPAGNYPTTCSGLTSSNYRITYAAGQLTITASACSADVDNSITVTRSGLSYNVLTKRYTQTLTLRNAGSAAIGSPIYLVLDSLGSNAALANGTGSTGCATPLGSPYVAVSGALAACASANASLQFTNPTNAAITYTTRILSGINP
jgi:MBG domain (YGX type)